MAQNHQIIITDHNTLKALIQQAIKEVLQPEGETINCPDTMLTPKQVARMLRVADKDIYQAVQEGSLTAIRHGRRWLIRQGDIAKWKQSKK